MSHDISQPDYLYRLAKSGSAHDREALAMAVTSLLQAQLTETERNLAQDILLRLLHEAEHSLRLSLAEQLAKEESCPQILLDYLIYKNDFATAAPVLKYSSALNDDYLIDVVKSFKNSDYWQAIAQRYAISEDLSLMLLDTKDKTTCDIVLKNPGAKLCAIGMNWLTNMAPEMPGFHEALLLRPEVTPELAAKIYWHASSELRDAIKQRFELPSGLLDAALNQAMQNRMVQKFDAQQISPDMLDFAFDLKQRNKITSRMLVDCLKQGDIALFNSLWAALLELHVETVVENLHDDFTSALAILCHAAGQTRQEFGEMYVAACRLHSGTMQIKADELKHALLMFDHMNPDKARRVVAAWHSDIFPTVQ